MQTVNIKPMTVNRAWKGRRFKTAEYLNYRKDMLMILPRVEVPEGKLMVELVWGFSNRRCDLDNPVKPFLDILQEKYKFDDSRVYELSVKKEIVSRGKEFIKFKILPWGE